MFDPATIKDRATYENANQLSEGVKYVVVNGQIEFQQGQLTGTKAGEVLARIGVEEAKYALESSKGSKL